MGRALDALHRPLAAVSRETYRAGKAMAAWEADVRDMLRDFAAADPEFDWSNDASPGFHNLREPLGVVGNLIQALPHYQAWFKLGEPVFAEPRDLGGNPGRGRRRVDRARSTTAGGRRVRILDTLLQTLGARDDSRPSPARPTSAAALAALVDPIWESVTIPYVHAYSRDRLRSPPGRCR